jgi:hypothetical protein
MQYVLFQAAWVMTLALIAALAIYALKIFVNMFRRDKKPDYLERHEPDA